MSYQCLLCDSKFREKKYDKTHINGSWQKIIYLIRKEAVLIVHIVITVLSSNRQTAYHCSEKHFSM